MLGFSAIGQTALGETPSTNTAATYNEAFSQGATLGATFAAVVVAAVARADSVAGGFSQAQHGVPLWRYPVTIAVNRNPFLRNPQFTTASKAARLFGQCGGCALGSVAREGSGCVMRPALRYWPVGRSAGLDCMAAFDPLRTLAGCAKVLPCSRIGLKSARRMRLLGRHCPRAALCSAGWRRRKTSI